MFRSVIFFIIFYSNKDLQKLSCSDVVCLCCMTAGRFSSTGPAPVRTLLWCGMETSSCKYRGACLEDLKWVQVWHLFSAVCKPSDCNQFQYTVHHPNAWCFPQVKQPLLHAWLIHRFCSMDPGPAAPWTGATINQFSHVFLELRR